MMWLKSIDDLYTSLKGSLLWSLAMILMMTLFVILPLYGSYAAFSATQELAIARQQ